MELPGDRNRGAGPDRCQRPARGSRHTGHLDTPADTSQVVGYQVLCLPRPARASTATYESCGLDSSATGSTIMTAADQTELCSAEISAPGTSVRLAGLEMARPTRLP